MEYYIYITNDCNLNCTYCSVMLDKDKTSIPLSIQYPIEKLRKFVDVVQKSFKDKEAIIYFFGGEPSLDWGSIQKVIDGFVCVKAYEVSFILHTNGLLLGNTPDKILNKISTIILSLNYEKIYKNGGISDYFYGIAQSIKQVKQKKDISIMGRLTTTNTTSLYTACTLTGNFFDYVYWQIDNQEIVEDVENYKAQYKKEISLLFDYWFSYLRQDVVLYYIPFLGIIRNFIDEKQFGGNYYCGFGNYSIFVQTDGICYACCEAVEEGQHKIGSIDHGIKFADMKPDNAKCLKCAYLKICGGRCGRMHKDFRMDRISDFCELNIFTIKMIENNLPEIKKLLKNNPYFFDAIFDYHLDYTELLP